MNQRLDKLAAAQADFIAHKMLPPDQGPLPGSNADDDDELAHALTLYMSIFTFFNLLY